MEVYSDYVWAVIGMLTIYGNAPHWGKTVRPAKGI